MDGGTMSAISLDLIRGAARTVSSATFSLYDHSAPGGGSNHGETMWSGNRTAHNFV